jgi:hypothetical protein
MMAFDLWAAPHNNWMAQKNQGHGTTMTTDN